MIGCLRPAFVFAAAVALSGCMVSTSERASPPPAPVSTPEQTSPLPELVNTPERTSPIPELVHSDKTGEMNLFLYTDRARTGEAAGRQGYNLTFPIDKRRQDQ